MAILVKNELVEKNEGYGRSINQLFNLYLKPFYREKGGKFDRNKFQAVIMELFDDGRAPKIKLGKDVNFEIKFKKGKKIKPDDLGKTIKVDLKDVENISWSSNRVKENSAKVLILKFNKNWWIFDFDFLYNKGDARKKLDRAKEFLSACKTILRKKEYCPHVLMYLIWSAAELIVDAKSMVYTQRIKNKHYDRKKIVTSPISKSIFSSDFQNLFITYHKNRNGARYGDKNFSKKYSIKDFRTDVKIIGQELNNLWT